MGSPPELPPRKGKRARDEPREAAPHHAERDAELAERKTFFRDAAAHSPFVAVPTDHAVYVVSTGDRGVGQSLFVRRSRSEMRTLRLALEALKALGVAEGDVKRTILDVGANIGTTSIYALAGLGFRSAIAIEPLPDNLRLLRMNVTANDLHDRFVILPFAVADEPGVARLTVTPGNSGNSQVLPAEVKPRENEIEVPQTSLDALVAQGVIDPGEIGLVWLDVQGYEGHVLAGASALIERKIPIVLELSPRLLRRRSGALERLGEALRQYTDVIELLSAAQKRGFAPRPTATFDDYVAEREREDGVSDILVVDRGAAATSART